MVALTGTSVASQAALICAVCLGVKGVRSHLKGSAAFALDSRLTSLGAGLVAQYHFIMVAHAEVTAKTKKSLRL